MRRSLTVPARSLEARRARFIIGSTVLLVGAALWMANAHAQGCGEQHDMLVASDPLALVRPVDCASLLAPAPDFSWPAQDGARGYSIALTFPDGHVETRSTRSNSLAWQRPLPPGDYRWTVRVEGASQASSARSFTVDRLATPAQAAVRAPGRIIAVN